MREDPLYRLISKLSWAQSRLAKTWKLLNNWCLPLRGSLCGQRSPWLIQSHRVPEQRSQNPDIVLLIPNSKFFLLCLSSESESCRGEERLYDDESSFQTSGSIFELQGTHTNNFMGFILLCFFLHYFCPKAVEDWGRSDVRFCLSWSVTLSLCSFRLPVPFSEEQWCRDISNECSS